MAYSVLAVVAITVLLGPGIPAACRASSPSPYAVSYLVTADSDSNSYSPMEGVPSAVMPPHTWDWRIFDPASGSDRLFLRLRSFPVGIRWDSSFAHVDFLLGNKIARAPWKFGGEVKELAQLPTDSSFCDFWQGRNGSWYVVTQTEHEYELPDGRRMAQQIGVRWDLPVGSSSWIIGEVDSAAGGHYGECYVTAKLERGALRPRLVTVASLSPLGFGSRHVSIVSRDTHGSRNATEWVWVPSESDTTIGFEMGAAEGDSYHALEPLHWVDRKSGRSRVVYPLGQSHSQCGGQISFSERLGLALITSEYDGGYPRIVDMKSGAISLDVNRPSARAVWVPPPR